MITCNYCGKPTQAGLARCSNCGTPLANTMSSGGAGRMPMPGQPELPAWLETLRAGEPGGTPSGGLEGNSGSSFSPDDFVDENLLPSWMQAERNDVGDSNPSGKHVAQRPASMPAPNTDGAFIPTKGMSASSFIDAQFLPSWLQEKQATTPNSPQESISAASLVQPDALPTWMQTASQEQVATPQPPLQNNQYVQPGPPQAIIGNDLIDKQGLPEWLAGKNVLPAANGQAGFTASSLIDEDELPPWMREGGQEQRGRAAYPSVPLGNMQNPLYSPQQDEGQVPSQEAAYRQPQNAPQVAQANTGNSVSASSFIDVNALPEWLRAPAGGPLGAAPEREPQGANEQHRSIGVPPRADYVRVPSRPRHEIGSSEDSAIAANTFASMLGVASAAPFFPGQGTRDAAMGQMPMGQPLPPMQSLPGQNMPSAQMGNAITPNPAATWGAPVSQSAPYMASGVQQAGAGTPTSLPPTNYTPANSLSGMPQSSSSSVPGMQTETMNNGQTKTPPKPAKRGFLSTILDWFSR